MFGTTPVTVAAVLYLLVQGQTGNAIAFLVIGLIAGITDNFVRPAILGGTSKIHPLAGLVFTFGAIAVFGFSGLFLGPVVAGLLFELATLSTKTESIIETSSNVDLS